MAMNEQAKELADQWLDWLRTRRFMAPPVPPSLLSLMMKGSISEGEPDGPMSPEMPAFNAAVMALFNQKPELAYPFIRVYCGFPITPVKSIASEIGVSTKTYYDLAHKGADEVIRRMNLVINLRLL
ncbi:hypothetical protein [Azonexus sp. IMCC34839]|uniref:hypothetical protein n=1 Tax=Azonexus sp. IMCC34839 TaxID=3133695 RepID=UPI003999D6C4